MAMQDPQTPLRADHRYIKQIVSVILGGKVEPVPREFDLISQVFLRAGGSWKRVFEGSPLDIGKLKRVIRAAYKQGYMTKKYHWGKA